MSAWSAQHTGGSSSAPSGADCASGGCSLGCGQRAWNAQCIGLLAKRQVSASLVGVPPAQRLELLAAASHMPPQTVQSIVKALTVNSESIHRAAIVQDSAIHSEFTHNSLYSKQTVQSTVKALTVQSESTQGRYSAIHIEFTHSAQQPALQLNTDEFQLQLISIIIS